MIDRYGERCLIELTDGNPPRYEADQAKVEKALLDAGALVDGYLSARYKLPLPTTPALIGQLVESIAIYRLYVSRPPDIEQDYKNAIETLKQISKGLIQLPISENSAAPAQQGGVEFEGDAPLLDRKSLGGFI